MSNKLDWSKPIQTRDGRAARVICFDKETYNSRPIVVLVKNDECEFAHCYGPGGHFNLPTSNSPSDIINVPERMVKASYDTDLYQNTSQGSIHLGKHRFTATLPERIAKAAGLDYEP